MKKKGKFSHLGILLVFTLLLYALSAFAMDFALSSQGTDVINKSTGQAVESGNLQVEIWDSLTGGFLIYNESFPGAIKNGSWNVMLGENSSNPLSLEYGKKYYKEYRINGEDVDFTNLTGNTVERQFFYAPLGAINYYNYQDDLTINGRIGIGTSSPSNFNLQVNGSIGPETDNVSDIGLDGQAFRNIYASNTVLVGSSGGGGTLKLNNDYITDTDSNLTLSTQGYSVVINDDFWVKENAFLQKNLTINGNVGIGGLPNSGHALYVNGSILIESDSSGSPYAVLNIKDSRAGSPQYGIYNGYPNQGDFTIRENAVANRLVIKNGTGYIGIGTATPTHKLTVVGDGNFTGTVYAHNFSGNSDITFINASGAPVMTIKDSGRVGIGTSSPTQTLTVVGDLNVTGTSYLGDITIEADNITVNTILPKDNNVVGVIGTINASTNIQVNGVDVCLENGTNCESVAGGTFIGLSSYQYTGNITDGTKVGYEAANQICANNFTNSHFCQAHEIIWTIAVKDISGFANNGWIAEGAPGYTADANDCNGWTSPSSSVLGSFWDYDSSGGGMGWLTNCGQSKNISCCR